jgi:hypothetical protein
MLWMIAISTTRQKTLEKKNLILHNFFDKNKIKMLGGAAMFFLLVI